MPQGTAMQGVGKCPPSVFFVELKAPSDACSPQTVTFWAQKMYAAGDRYVIYPPLQFNGCIKPTTPLLRSPCRNPPTNFHHTRKNSRFFLNIPKSCIHATSLQKRKAPTLLYSAVRAANGRAELTVTNTNHLKFLTCQFLGQTKTNFKLYPLFPAPHPSGTSPPQL